MPIAILALRALVKLYTLLVVNNVFPVVHVSETVCGKCGTVFTQKLFKPSITVLTLRLC